MKTKLIKVALTSVLALGASVSLSAQGTKIEEILPNAEHKHGDGKFGFAK